MTALFTHSDAGTRLLATRCKQCQATFFPSSPFCRACGGDDVEAHGLAAGGVIETYTRVNDVAVADVRLDDGVLVFGRVEPTDLADIGVRVTFAPQDEIVRFEIDA